ncbi:hypothetical protein K0M31_012580 [Melipona bicolor]|uniref:Retrotransposon gag domain-containing protein n=1 Tax=Melipona bicolor TaxID=60889 RepID=A0AA40KH74_9HYME|nr:hypothetical protein K0M31_012580 [Melipona bicolor]
MATQIDLQKLNETITSNFELLTKQINERNSIYDDNFKKINRRTDSHEQMLENLTKIIRKLEIANEKQNTEFKNLAQDLKTYAYSETVHTDLAPEMTEDETVYYSEKTTQRANTKKSKRESANQKEATREDLILKPTDALRVIESLNGTNDIGVEEFIKSVKLARTRVNDQIILLRMIIAEKITDRAKQSIRFCQITSYEELFSALRTHVSIPNTISGSRNKLQNIRQGNNETVQSYSNRFKQALSELKYSIQAKYSNPISRNLALEQENTEAIKFYIHNLRPDLAYCIMAMQPGTLLGAQQRAIDADVWVQDMANRKLNYRNFNVPARKTENRPNTQTQIIRRPFNTTQNSPIQLKCDNCQRIGHTRSNCYLLKQNFPSLQHGKIPPRRINRITATDREHDDEIPAIEEPPVEELATAEIKTMEGQIRESTTHPESYNMSGVNSPECQEVDDCSWTPEQE